MSKFSKLEGQDVVVESALAEVSPVEEGWGAALAQVGTITGIFGSIVGGAFFGIKGLLLGAAGTAVAAAANKKLQNISESQVKKVLANPKMQKYITDECNKIYSKLAKYYKSSSGNSFIFEKKVSVNTVEVSGSDDITNINDNSEYSKSKVQRLKEYNKNERHYLFIEQLGDYTIGLYADSDHVQGIDVFFLLTNKDKDNEPRVVHHNIPAPTNEELKELGFVEKPLH